MLIFPGTVFVPRLPLNSVPPTHLVCIWWLHCLYRSLCRSLSHPHPGWVIGNQDSRRRFYSDTPTLYESSLTSSPSTQRSRLKCLSLSSSSLPWFWTSSRDGQMRHTATYTRKGRKTLHPGPWQKCGWERNVCMLRWNRKRCHSQILLSFFSLTHTHTYIHTHLTVKLREKQGKGWNTTGKSSFSFSTPVLATPCLSFTHKERK